MEEVFIKNNSANLRIYINGKPQLANMPAEDLNLMICCIEIQMSEHYKLNRKKSKNSKINA